MPIAISKKSLQELKPQLFAQTSDAASFVQRNFAELCQKDVSARGEKQGLATTDIKVISEKPILTNFDGLVFIREQCCIAQVMLTFLAAGCEGAAAASVRNVMLKTIDDFSKPRQLDLVLFSLPEPPYSMWSHELFHEVSSRVHPEKLESGDSVLWYSFQREQLQELHI